MTRRWPCWTVTKQHFAMRWHAFPGWRPDRPRRSPQRLRQICARGIPRGPRPGTRANPANLTLRELEILPLLVDGLQNGEIADQLFLSVKTVGHHVSSILNKLGVRRRADVAGAAERFGILLPRDRDEELVALKETPSR